MIGLLAVSTLMVFILPSILGPDNIIDGEKIVHVTENVVLGGLGNAFIIMRTLALLGAIASPILYIYD